MTKDDIIRMAREADLPVAGDYIYRGGYDNMTLPEQQALHRIEHFTALVAAAEREECIDWIKAFSIVGDRSEEMIAAIRASGEK